MYISSNLDTYIIKNIINHVLDVSDWIDISYDRNLKGSLVIIDNDG